MLLDRIKKSSPDQLVLYTIALSIVFGLCFYFLFINVNYDAITSDWETYANSEYSFEYPLEWNTAVNKNNTKNLLFGPNATSDFGLGGVEIFSGYASVDDLLNDVDAEYSNKQEATVGGITGIRTKYRGVVSGEAVILLKDGYIYNIFVNSNKESDVRFFNHIVSTFRFKNSTTDWKTYKNEQYGYEIQYPSSWKFGEGFDNGGAKMFIFTGDQGEIGIGYGIGLDVCDSKNYEKIQLNSEQLDFCHGFQPDGSQYWYANKIGGDALPGQELPGISATINKPSISSNKDVILEILSTFKFTK